MGHGRIERMGCVQRRSAARLLVGVAVLCAVGCQAERTRINLVTYDADGTAHRHYADFQEGYYRLSSHGGIELVLRSEQPSRIDPTQTITQVVYLKAFWIPQPGTTFVESSQINAQLQYAVWTPPTGVRYDGAGFASFHLDRRRSILTGRIESGSLTPRFRAGNAVEPFGTARFTGRFRATQDPARVVSLVQWLQSCFGHALGPS